MFIWWLIIWIRAADLQTLLLNLLIFSIESALFSVRMRLKNNYFSQKLDSRLIFITFSASKRPSSYKDLYFSVSLKFSGPLWYFLKCNLGLQCLRSHESFSISWENFQVAIYVICYIILKLNVAIFFSLKIFLGNESF